MGGRGALRGTAFAEAKDKTVGGGSGGSVEFEGYGAKEKAFLKKLTGENISPEQLANLIGAPEDAFVSVSMTGGELRAIIEHPLLSEMERFIGKDDDGDVYINNSMFFVDYKRDASGDILNTKGQVYQHEGDTPQSLAPAGFGTKSFARQVEAGRKLGISYIKTYALRNDDPVEPAFGSYTWARLGYDGHLSRRTQSRLAVDPAARNFRSVKTVHQLMRHSQEARNWWRTNHEGFSGIFSLERGSTSLRVFNSYTRQRGIKTNRTPARDRGTGYGNEYSRRIPDRDRDIYGNF